jgi:hypothetical protein
VKQTVFMKFHSAVNHRTFLAEMPVGWRLSPPEFGKEIEISREDFEAIHKTEVCPMLIDGQRYMLFEEMRPGTSSWRFVEGT